MSTYIRSIQSVDGYLPVKIDVYGIIRAYEISDPELQHAIKKILCAGQRGVKSKKQDILEAIQSLNIWIETQRNIESSAEFLKEKEVPKHE